MPEKSVRRDKTFVPHSAKKVNGIEERRNVHSTRKTSVVNVSARRRPRPLKRSSSFERPDRPSLLQELLAGEKEKVVEEKKDEESD